MHVDLLRRADLDDLGLLSSVDTAGTDVVEAQNSIAFSSTIAAPLRDSEPIDERRPPHRVPFGELWQRVADVAAREVLESGEGPYTSLTADLMRRLSRVGEATLWSELNARRSPRDVVVEHLRPEGPRRTKYCGLLEELRSDGLCELTGRYPVLRRQLVTTLQHWREATSELLARVQVDRGLLAATFGVPEGAALVEVRPGLSDPHRRGRTVAALTFRDAADEHTIVYKPKDLRLDQAFQQLLADVPKPRASDDHLRGIVVLPRAGYGYMEWVPHVLSGDPDRLGAFYRNAGRLAAVLHLLCATDCHHENFVAHDDQLILVDGEALFQGTPRDRNTDRRHSVARSGLYDRMGDSVVRLGMLPQWYFTGDKRIPQDVSALGIAPPVRARSSGVGWLEPGTDGMITGRVERVADVPTSSPVGVGSPNRLVEFADDFCDGFGSQLAAIAAERARWAGDSGHLARFRTYRSRFIRRATWTYFWAIGEQSEPEALRCEARQRQVLAKLSRDRLPFVARPADPRVVAAEAAQLRRLDVPFFEQPVDGTYLITGDPTPIPDFFESSAFFNAQRKLLQLDAEAIELQLSMIRGVLAAKERHAHRPAGPRRPAHDPGRRRLPAVDRQRHAVAIGDQLVAAAISDHTGAVEWLGIEVAEDTERSSYGPLGLSLYAGRTGIALFLAALARRGVTRAETYERAALGAVSDLSRLCDDRVTRQDARGWWREQTLGVASGGGILLALVHLRTLLPTIRQRIEGVTTFLVDALNDDVLAADRQLDVIFGSAGLIGPLLKIGTPRAAALAEAAGDRLVEAQDDSGGWASRAGGGAALTGFSHGASGIAAALIRLHTVTGRQRYLDSARAALEWERRHFDRGAGNWVDRRGDPDSPTFMLSWCHGAPGIGLARLCLAGTPLWDSAIEDDLGHALRSTAEATFPEDSLCCGRFGRAAILRTAARAGRGNCWLDAAARLESDGMADRAATGRYSFTDVPGLFQGLSGIGLALLDDSGELLPDILSAGLYRPGPSGGPLDDQRGNRYSTKG